MSWTLLSATASRKHRPTLLLYGAVAVDTIVVMPVVVVPVVQVVVVTIVVVA